MGRVTARVPRLRVEAREDHLAVIERPDPVVVEEPLQLRVGGAEVTVTMRTPGDDFDWALGHLITEGLIESVDQVATMMHCNDTDANGVATFNVVDVSLAPGTSLRRQPSARAAAATSACGVCGSESVAEVLDRVHHPVSVGSFQIDPQAVLAAPALLEDTPSVHDRTGGVHTAVLTPLTQLAARASTEEPTLWRQDVGRHNAVDKVIGAAARIGQLPVNDSALNNSALNDSALIVSSRAGFEIVAKAASVAIPVVIALSAPTSLAIELAEASGITLVAFARETTFAAYSHSARINLPTD